MLFRSTVIACVGDGAYVFANPAACHMTAAAENLPVVVIIANNAQWEAVKRSTVLPLSIPGRGR